MNLISFKKMKFFKSPAFLPKKDMPLGNGHKPEKRPLSHQVLESPIIFLAGFVFILSYFISYIPSKSLGQLKVGEIAAADVIAPDDVTIEDVETTERRRIDAANAVLPVYLYNSTVFPAVEEKILQLFAMGREWQKKTLPAVRSLPVFRKAVSEKLGLDIEESLLDSLNRINFSADIEETLTQLTEKTMEKGLLRSKGLFIHKEAERGFTLVRPGAGEMAVRAANVEDLKDGKAELASEVENMELPPAKKQLLTDLAESFLVPNIIYSKTESELRQNEARSRVETVFYSIKRGKVIVRKGDEVKAENLKEITLINQSLLSKPNWRRNFLGTFLLFSLIFITLWYFLKSILRQKSALDHFIMMGTTLLISLLFYKFFLFLGNTISLYTRIPVLTNTDIFWYALPYQLGALVFAFLTANHITLVYTILNSLLVGYLFKASFFQMVFCFIGGLAAMYGIKVFGKQKRTSILRAGLLTVAPINAFVILTIYLISEKAPRLDTFAGGIFMGIVGGVMSACLAFLFLPLHESVFGFVTSIKLLELTNSDLPIFRQMAIEAPGSYHHSLIVSTLAEKAAEEIKLDAMLVKAGAMYHDIGKIKMPEYFIENTIRNPDMHRDLTPRLSTLVIVNHVKEGVELARKLKLPQKIREIIAQHHGNSLIRYFYQKAMAQSDPEKETVGEETYRYPGPPPQSKEAGLVLLSDSVEAAARSLKSPTKENLKRVILDIFDGYLQDGQFDQCDFSLRELRTIAASFLNTLYGIYHPRVKYPDFNFERKKNRKTEKPDKKGDDHDRNHQPPE